MQRSIGSRSGLLVVVAVLAGCSVAPGPSAAPLSASEGPSPSGWLATPAPPAPTAPTPDPTPTGPIGGGLLVVFQLDGLSWEDAGTQTVFTVDVGTGERRELATIPVDEDTCCPTEVYVAADRSLAFLHSAQYLGTVDLVTGALAPRPKDLQGFNIANSNAGDRLAWLDEFSGGWESLNLVDLGGNELGKVELPETAWQTQFAWAPDDSAFAVATVLTIPGLKFPVTPEPAAAACCGMAAGLTAAVDLACCTPDHGVTASALLVVPVNGDPTTLLVDTEDLVRHDLEVPNPTWPPTMGGNATLEPERGLSSPTWAPDGRSIAYVHSTCEVTFEREFGLWGDCTYQLRVVEVADATDRLVWETDRNIWSPTWSPTGDRIGFLGVTNDDPRNQESGLFLVDPDGGEPVLLSDAIGNVHWSPDGTWLSFERLNATRTDGDRADLWAMPLDGGDARLIAEHAAGGW